jgi:hypothetical protein
MITRDKAMVQSAFERNEGEKYYTEHWMTRALMRRLNLPGMLILEPACGRGDIIDVLVEDDGIAYSDIIACDLDMSDFDETLYPVRAAGARDFLNDELLDPGVEAIVMNPPYNLQDEFIEHALSMPKVQTVAALLRGEVNHAGKRRSYFDRQPFGPFKKVPFAFEIVLTSRPRWDWWLTEDQKRQRRVKAGLDPNRPDAGPRHNFSWFVWDRRWEGHSTQFWEGKKAA